MSETIALSLTAILAAGVGAQWLAWWLRLPAILPLLLIGLLAGPVFGWLRPDALFGDLLFPIVSLSVAVILFEGALTLHFAEIRGQMRVVRNLVSFGALINWLLVALAARWFMDLPSTMALLFGALVTVTGPTVIAPLLRTVRPQREVANILRWESIVIDPIGALLAVLVFEFAVTGQNQHQHTMMLFAANITAGVGLGLIGAWLLAQLIRRELLPEYLHRIASLALVLGIFTLSNSVAGESGLLAVTVMGIRLANTHDLVITDILNFKEALTLLLISILFILLAARIDLQALAGVGWGALGVLLAIILVARPAAVWLSAIGSSLNWRQKAALAWIAPRGIVAAAISALFALRLEQLGHAEAGILATLTFLVILVTVILQSLTARPVVEKLGLAAPPPRGVLIMGATPVGRAIAKALHEKEIPVLLADPVWQNLRAARMAGIRVYHGNIMSEHADTYLDLSSVGTLMAMSYWPERNALVGLYYRPLLGAEHVYSLRLDHEHHERQRNRIRASYHTNRLFDEVATMGVLQERLNQGHTIRATALTATFDFAAFRQRWGEQAIVLFAIDSKGALKAFSERETPQPQPGWTVISLLPPSKNAETG